MENQQEQELTHEELAARKSEMKQFYEDSIPYLEAQLKYEKFLTDIEETRFKRASFQYQFAMMMSQQQEQEEEGADNELETKAPERKLKKN
jgi:hypothetical protein